MRVGYQTRTKYSEIRLLEQNSAAEAWLILKTRVSETDLGSDLTGVAASGALSDNHVERRSVSWDLRQGPKNYVSLVAAQIASGALSFAAVWFTTRLLGSTGYGAVVAIIAASQAIGHLAVNWTAVSLSRYGVQEFVETGRLAKSFWTRFWIFLPNVVLVIGTSPLWLPSLSSLLKLPPRAHFFILGHFLASAIWIHVQQGLQGAKLLRLQASLLTFERVLVLLIVVACYLSGNASFLTIALAYIFGPLGASCAGLWALRRFVFPISTVDRDLLRRMVKFSLPILPASLVGYMATNYLDAFFITHYLSGAALGVYAVAYLISGTASQLPLLVGTVLMPLFITLQIDGTDDRARRFMLNVLPLLALFWGIACAFIAVVGAFFFPRIFGEQFLGIGELLWPLMTAAALAGPILMGYAPFSNSKSVTYITMIGAIAAAITNIVLNFLLIPKYGLLGCAWATTAAFAVNTIAVIALVHWRLLRSSPWILQALLPVVIGAICASMYALNFSALGVTLLISGSLALLNRKYVAAGFRMLRGFQRSQSEVRG